MWWDPGVCYMHLKEYDFSREQLLFALEQNKHHQTFAMLAKLYLLEGDMQSGINTYKAAIEWVSACLCMSRYQVDFAFWYMMILFVRDIFQDFFFNLLNNVFFIFISGTFLRMQIYTQHLVCSTCKQGSTNKPLSIWARPWPLSLKTLELFLLLGQWCR